MEVPLEGVSEPDRLADCESRLGHVFRDRDLLIAALTHASGADHRLASNERLEFLGDAILGFVCCDELYRRFPNQQEGELTKIKSSVVSRRTCAKVAKRLRLDEFLILGKGMSGPQPIPDSLFSDVFEALIAAIYLDSGIEVVSKFVRHHLADEIDEIVAGQASANPKSQLQQLAQRLHGQPPQYLLLQETGPDHCKTFQVAAQVGDLQYEPAWGRNKKEAEQRAAGNALAQLVGETPSLPELEEASESESEDE